MHFEVRSSMSAGWNSLILYIYIYAPRSLRFFPFQKKDALFIVTVQIIKCVSHICSVRLHVFVTIWCVCVFFFKKILGYIAIYAISMNAQLLQYMNRGVFPIWTPESFLQIEVYMKKVSTTGLIKRVNGSSDAQSHLCVVQFCFVLGSSHLGHSFTVEK